MVSTLIAAKDYAARGLPITVCRDKHPLGIGWTPTEAGEKWQDKIWDGAELDTAWETCGALNLGIMLGPKAGFIDMEADGDEEEESFRKLFDGVEIPKTPMFKSRRGVHRLFGWSEVLAVTGKAVIDFEGLGIRIGANGKAAHSCVPPSVNSDGTAREWIVSLDDCATACLPDIVLRRILEANKPEPAPPVIFRPNGAATATILERARKYLQAVPGAISGQRGQDATFHAACVLVLDFNLTPDEAWPAFCEWNERCVPPWDERRLRRKLDEANKKTGERGRLLVDGRTGTAHGRLQSVSNSNGNGHLDVNGHDDGEQSERPWITNADRITADKETETVPRSIEYIKRQINEVSGHWPRNVGGNLFVDDPKQGICFFNKPSELFGWMHDLGSVAWHATTGCITREETFAELKRTATRYKAVEVYPHFPPMDGHYYSHRTVAPGSGAALAGLLDFFCPETPVDRDLIEAAIATVFWGGLPGARPAFLVTAADRGHGKSTVPKIIGRLAGGCFDFALGEQSETIKKRLLSPEALIKRMAQIDNIKSNKVSSGDIEGIITGTEISGHALFQGERTRPNTLTWFLTVNGVGMSRDFSQRSIVIRLAKPTHCGDWENLVNAYVEARRWEIIADVAGFFLRPAAPLSETSRWGTWEAAILARLAEPGEAQRVVAERQAAVDSDDEEAGDLEAFFAAELEKAGYDPERDCVHIPYEIGRHWYNAATGDRELTRAIVRQIRQGAEAGLFKRIRMNPSRTNGRGFLWKSEGRSLVDYRLAEKVHTNGRCGEPLFS
jgi:hypothetical protein